MNAAADPADDPVREETVYEERFPAPWWFWLGSILVAVLLAATFNMGVRSIDDRIAYAVTIAIALAICVNGSRSRLVITADGHGGGTIHVPGARLPFDAVGRVRALSASEKRAALGHQFDPAAFVSTHLGVRRLVLITVDDDADPTPFWLIGTRHPEAVVDALPDSRWN